MHCCFCCWCLQDLTFPDPPPEEEGILVNFGTDDTGFGHFEPMGA
jgi:hypothetical protein